MARTLTVAAQAVVQSHRAELVHLLSLAFSGGTIRFTSGPHPVTWDGVQWSAAGAAMSFDTVSETPDASGQRLRITLDGVNLEAVTALLEEHSIGRLATLRRAYLDSTGTIVADPVVLFTGYLNAPWEVSEDWDGRWAKVQTEIVSPLAVFEQIRGITADLHSHQAHYPGDTFFAHIMKKPGADFGWGRFTEFGPWRW